MLLIFQHTIFRILSSTFFSSLLCFKNILYYFRGSLSKKYTMKKISTLVAVAAIGISALTGCKKSDSSSSSYNMKATVGTTAFNTSNCIATYSSGILQITAWTGSSSSATFPIMQIDVIGWNQATGTTTFDSTATTGIEEYLPTSSSAFIDRSGTLHITAVSATSISGTFSFTGTDGTAVTGGSFTAKR